jgi:hypothetical protein
MRHDLLRLHDCLLHGITLLFSGVSREDSELVELDAVHEEDPGMHVNAFVGLAIHTNPRVFHVHLIHDPIPLHLHLANNEATEQLVSLLGLCNSNIFLGLDGFLEFVELRFSSFFLGSNLVNREFKKRAHLLPNCN